MKFLDANLKNKWHEWRGSLDLYQTAQGLVARHWPHKASYKRQAKIRSTENRREEKA